MYTQFSIFIITIIASILISVVIIFYRPVYGTEQMRISVEMSCMKKKNEQRTSQKK